ncbi:hypothetical protein P0F03_003069 [Vibrio metschnikovii]|nr:hypothetical protein [Vibrio metschnikovii]EKO3733193.1 hypothetical protein [Vibrio metschnikovii]
MSFTKQKTINEAELNPIFYVCVLSKYNLPQLEAILTRRPSDVLFVVSDFKPAKDGAENLSKLLEEELPGIRVHRPDWKNEDALSGDDLINSQQWVAQTLVPYLNRHKGDHLCWLNLTGGTKAITLALSLGYPWDQLDYKPISQNSLFGFDFQAGNSSSSHFSNVDAVPLISVTPQHVARTYNSTIKETTPNPLGQKKDSVLLAEAIFDALDKKDPALMQIFNALSRIWSHERANIQWNKEQLTLPLSEFLQCSEDEYHTDLFMWLKRFQQLDGSCFRLEDDNLTFPGNNYSNKAGRNFRKWLSGDWLEQLTGYWLTSFPGNNPIPASAIAYGVKAGGIKNPDQLREADLLIHHKGRTHIIEVKADIPPGSSSKEAVQQLNSLHAFGQANRLLMVGPEFRHRLSLNNDWSNFRERCADNNIRVCSNRNDLLQAF